MEVVIGKIDSNQLLVEFCGDGVSWVLQLGRLHSVRHLKFPVVTSMLRKVALTGRAATESNLIKQIAQRQLSEFVDETHAAVKIAKSLGRNLPIGIRHPSTQETIDASA